jgi:hypothetical protein
MQSFFRSFLKNTLRAAGGRPGKVPFLNLFAAGKTILLKRQITIKS